MVVTRQVFRYLAIADVVLFLIAVVFNDHSATSVDGIAWWLALFVFLLLIVAGMVIMIEFMRSRAQDRRHKRAR